MSKQETKREGFILTREQGMGIDWVQNDDLSESPDFYTDIREAAKEILNARIMFLQSRLENLDDPNFDPEDAESEAGDDMILGIEAVTIHGEGEGAIVAADGWEATLRELSKASGCNDPVIVWPPKESP